MKKILIFLLLFLTLCGCSKKNQDKFADYKHYNLSEKDIFTYSYVPEYGVNNTYAIADITSENSEIGIRGLFYKISSDDFILLDEIEHRDRHQSTNNKYNLFDGNKLYAIGNGSSPLITEYTLNYEKIGKKELQFEMPESDSGILISTIDHLQDNYIYFSAFTDYNGNKILKCSLDTYKCEIAIDNSK